MARCPVKACFMTYRAGPDRLCGQHQDSHGDAFSDLGPRMQAFMETAPGERDGGSPGQDGGDDRRRQPVTRMEP